MISQFQETIDHKLTFLGHFDCLSCQNVECNNDMLPTELGVLSMALTDILVQSANDVFPKTSPHKKSIQYWSEEIKPLKQTLSVFGTGYGKNVGSHQRVLFLTYTKTASANTTML